LSFLFSPLSAGNAAGTHGNVRERKIEIAKKFFMRIFLISLRDFVFRFARLRKLKK